MAKFVFSMQNILNMKEKLEEQEKNNYSQANMRWQEAIATLESLEQRLAEEKQKLQEEVSSALDVRKIRQREDGVEVIRMYVRQQMLEVKQREKEVEVARERLNEAMKERKTFEKLREKAFEKFRLEENLREQKELDELVRYRIETNRAK